MIKDFKIQLETFSYPETKELSEKYLEKYWLDNNEYVQKWYPLQNEIFELEKYFPEFVFKEDLNILVIGGGSVSNPADFETLKKCIQKIGDSEFVIIQHIDKDDPPLIGYLGEGWKEHPFLRFKFPADITWEELLSGGGVSDELFKPYKEYLLFGKKGDWGMYAANDYKYPVVIFGFIPSYDSVFKSLFTSPDKEKEELLNTLPLVYRKYV
jgi:hypothetical protein